jgi:hypothetical protein
MSDDKNITKHDTDNFEIYTRGVKSALDGYHDAFIKEYIQKVFTHPDDAKLIARLLDEYKEGFKKTLDGIDSELNRIKNIKFGINGTK